ncbi:hypothetical protein HU200_013873 [Digitaria exilis]|uniref:Xyloglucan endotransglucosylase/hydrolase n=1 Tax=Digitaria exilis TaxID=1010633 RepID=A0A835FCQ2_9POAL|nr:hypothetical protein HU200_013873 [Digitaria exilis]
MMKSLSRPLLLVVIAAATASLVAGDFREDCIVEWEPQNSRLTNDGKGVSLYLFPTTLISARTDALQQTSSVGGSHDEIDFEFLGNRAGEPYTIHTNVFVGDTGGREVQFKAWFDPAADYHNYTISWRPCMIVWYVDGVPVRVFRNYKASIHGAAFPTSRPMYGYCSIWASESDWATQGGRVRTDWSGAPFVARYRDIDLDVCNCSSSNGGCVTSGPAYGGACRLSDSELGQMQSVQRDYVIYNYCLDDRRWKNGKKPVECGLPQY